MTHSPPRLRSVRCAARRARSGRGVEPTRADVRSGEQARPRAKAPGQATTCPEPALAGLHHDEMRNALLRLDQALYGHEQCCETLNAALICGLAPDERDIASDAHRWCRFGQWLHGPGSAGVEAHPATAAIRAEHERMHRSAAAMLLAAGNRAPVSLADCESFGAALRRMRLAVMRLRRELEDAVHGLDPLTGVASRVGMLAKLREQQAFVQRTGRRCCIAMMDLDRFKAINDAHGHLVGDKVLVTVACQASMRLRPYDRIFRYGGEEFLICLPSTDLSVGLGVVERIRGELAAIAHEAEGKPGFQVTVSFGLALLDPEIPVERSIARADEALYAAKRLGRNRTVAWDATMASPSPGTPGAAPTAAPA